MEVEVPTVEGLLTLGGLSIVTTAVVEVAMRAWAPTPAFRSRFGPLVALVVALVFSLIAAFLTEASIFNAIITAILVGWTSMGVYDTLAKTVPPRGS